MEMSRMTVHLFLRSICNESGWNYAVFWKPKNQHYMLLTCSEAYYNFPESPNVNSADAGSCFYRNKLNHSGGAVSGYYGSDLQVTMREDVQLVDHIRSLFIHLHLPSEVGFTVSSVGCLPGMLTLGSGLPASSETSYAAYNLSRQKPWETRFEKAPGLATLDADQAIKSSLSNSEFSNLPMLTVEDDPEMWYKSLYACKFGPGGGHGADDEMVTDSVPTALAESSYMQNWHMEENSLYVTAALLNDGTQLCNNIEAGRQSRCDTQNQKIFAESPYTSHTLEKNLGQNLICKRHLGFTFWKPNVP